MSAESSDWFKKQSSMVKKIVNMMPVHFQVSHKQSVESENSVTICSSEVFYVPRRFVADFLDLHGLVGDLEIHHKVAIPLFFTAMDSVQNFDPVLNTMSYREKPAATNSSTIYSVHVPAVHPWNVSNEQDFIKLVRIMAEGDPLLAELV